MILSQSKRRKTVLLSPLYPQVSVYGHTMYNSASVWWFAGGMAAFRRNSKSVLTVGKEVKCFIVSDLAPTSTVFDQALYHVLFLNSSHQ